MVRQVEQSTRSTNRSFKRLIKLNGTKPQEIYKAICSQTVELIFTAHPTQVLNTMSRRQAEHPPALRKCS